MNTASAIRRRIRAILFCAAITTMTASGASLADTALGATLDGLIDFARTNNPTLAATRFDAAAARERITSATALSDPQLEVELMDVTNAMNRGRSASILPGEVGTTTWRMSQMLPYPGKRGLRGEIAEALAARADADSTLARLDVEVAIRRAYIEHFQAADQIRIIDLTIALTERLETLVLNRYELGLASQQDALQVQAELTSLKIDRLEAERQRGAAIATLNALLPRAPDAPLSEPVSLPALPAQHALAALIEQAVQHAPVLDRASSELAAAESARALTYRERYPDFGVSVANNRPRGGRDSWDLMFELNIPLQQASRRAREREAEYSRDAAEARRDAAAARLAGTIGETRAALEARRDQVRLVRDTLLPQTEASLASALAGYETGTVGFGTVIDAQRRILRTRLSLLDTEVEASLRAADLEQLLGAPL